MGVVRIKKIFKRFQDHALSLGKTDLAYGFFCLVEEWLNKMSNIQFTKKKLIKLAI